MNEASDFVCMHLCKHSTLELNHKSMPQEKLAMGHLYEWEVPMQELGGKEGERKFS